MSRTVSPSSKKPYGGGARDRAMGLGTFQLLCRPASRAGSREAQKRGPRVLSDTELISAMRQLPDEAVFNGEGYRKIWARFRHHGIRTSKDRVLQLLRENQLLSPARRAKPVRSNPHEGTIIAELPNQMWGAEATATFTETGGMVTVLAAIDHCTAECVGMHVVKKAIRFEALEPIRQGIHEQFGAFVGGTAAGLRLRHDHGSVYMSDDFQNEIRFLGIERSPAFVRQPEGNGCIERFFRALKNSYSGSAIFAISRSFARRSSSSAIGITIYGFSNA
jgi:putative transposase